MVGGVVIGHEFKDPSMYVCNGFARGDVWNVFEKPDHALDVFLILLCIIDFFYVGISGIGRRWVYLRWR